MYQGNFSNWVNSKNQLIPIYDPQSTAANPTGRFRSHHVSGQHDSAVAVQHGNARRFFLMRRARFCPTGPESFPALTGYVQNNYLTNGGDTVSPTDKGSVKIDQNFGSNHHLGFFYNKTRYDSMPGPAGPSGLPEPLWNGSVSDYQASLYRLSYDWTISPTLLNHFVSRRQ